jgi:hypothetical protein
MAPDPIHNSEMERDQELVGFLENEINFGLACLQTWKIADSREHADQAFGNATKAYRTALKFFEQVPTNEYLELRVRLDLFGERLVSATKLSRDMEIGR